MNATDIKNALTYVHTSERCESRPEAPGREECVVRACLTFELSDAEAAVLLRATLVSAKKLHDIVDGDAPRWDREVARLIGLLEAV